MRLVTSTEMRQMDAYTIDTIGIPALVLMENAGRAAAEQILRFRERRLGKAAGAPGTWAILVGKGNNGADGIVAARHLRDAALDTVLLYAVPPDSLRGEAAVQRDIASRLGIPALAPDAAGIAAGNWRPYEGIVDALLGTGSRGAPQEPYASWIRTAADSGLPVVSLDIPSGVDADTGAVHDPHIRAALTVSFGYVKQGLAVHPACEAAGELVNVPIGIPVEALQAVSAAPAFVTGEPELVRLGADPRKPRRADTHKGTYGHAAVVAGSRAMSGAGILCARAALRAGCGLATWAVPAALAAALAGTVPEAMLAPLADGGRGDWSAVRPEEALALLEGKTAAAIGPGLGRFAGDDAWIARLWERAALPAVFDADALNMIAGAGGVAALPRRSAPAVLTPHPGEMARLAGLPTAEVQRDRIGLARRYAAEHGVTLVLKGARTVIATPGGSVYVNPTGNPGMATGGSGDALAGIIASLLAQGLTPEQAAVAGTHWHGAAGDRAAAARAVPHSILAGDIIEHL